MKGLPFENEHCVHIYLIYKNNMTINNELIGFIWKNTTFIPKKNDIVPSKIRKRRRYRTKI